MFSCPFNSSSNRSRQRWNMLKLVRDVAWRKMISRKVRCASVEFWKASKHRFRANVLDRVRPFSRFFTSFCSDNSSKPHFSLPLCERDSKNDIVYCNPPTRFGVHSLLFLCSIQNFVTRCPSKIPSPKSKIQDPQNPKSKIQNPQNPKSKIPKIQNPKSPNSKIQTLHIKICYIMFQKSKIQNPQNPENPKSKIPKIQNPKSKLPKIQNPKSPKSKIQNPKSPKSKIQNPQNPKSKIPKIQKSKLFWPDFGDFGDFGFWGFGILDFGFGIPAPKSKIQTPQNPKSKIQNPQNPKCKIPKIQNPQNPKSKIPKIQNPKSSAKIQNLGRWGPHVKNCYITIQNPKSKIPKIRPKKFGFWIFGILDFGFWILGILDFGFWDFGDFGFWILGFWILDFGFWGFWILDFGILGILDFGDFGFWGFWDFGGFGFWGFWGFWILGFWGGPGDVPLGNLATVPGGQRLESPLVCLWGPLQNQLYRIELGQGSKLNIFSEVRTLQNHRKTLTSNPEVRTLQNHRKTQTSNPEVRTLQNHRKNPDFQPRGQNFTKSQKNLDFSPYRRILSIVSYFETATSLLWTFWRKLMWITRVGGHRRQPVLNPAMHKASDAGHIGPHGMRRCLSFSYRGRRHVPPTRPRRQKNGSLLKSARCA